jgi:UDP-N-acetylmuramate--alanine ligase
VRTERWTPPEGSIPTLGVPSLRGVRRAHLVGIGGAGMRNLARLLVARGLEVRGSDLKESAGIGELRRLGIEVHVGHDAAHAGDADVVIVSSAIPEANPERRHAHDAGIAVWARQQAVAALAEGSRAIAVSGTHGKTTTTSMLAHALTSAGADPTYLIGGDLNESGSGARHGGSDLFLYEADESDGSFLLARPWIGLVTNVETDHVDFYPGGQEEIERAFADFVDGCEVVVAWGDDPAVRRVLQAAGREATTYGNGPANDLVVSVGDLGPAGARGSVRVGGREVTLRLGVDGPHQLLNAAAAVAVAAIAGVDPAAAGTALEGFRGVHRRFEYRGSARGADFFDDYGHNPTEMEVTLQTARRRGPARLIALVQPHRYSRVEAMWRELGASVVEADLVVVTDVYGAEQTPIPGVTGERVVEGIRLADPATEVVYLPHRQEVIEFLDREVRAGDLVVTMGCGDVWMLGDATLERLRAGEA